MNIIDFPRYDVYGEMIDRDTLEKQYVKSLSKEIGDRLENDVLPSIPSSPSKEALTKRIIRYLPQILVMRPARMERYAKAIDRLYGGDLTYRTRGGVASTKFGKKLIGAFDFKHYRKTLLVELSACLNVKTCPYCNMSFTLYSERLATGKKRITNCDRFVKFQFDHFFSKVKYPMLSMSLYNLIPACPVCNQGKSDRDFPLLFHPYHSDICSLFSFEVENPMLGYTGARLNDYTPVKLKWDARVSARDQQIYENSFHLEVLYSRHGDIVQEIYDKAYEDPYYSNPANFSFLSDRGKDYLKRLWFDDYMTPDLIHRRPLSKFKQDILKQALKDK